MPTPVIVALDYPRVADALSLVDQLDPAKCRLKIGKEMYTRHGPSLVKQLHQRGFELFLDLKFHDIPNTVARACASAAELGVWMLNVHASGGRRMMEAAREALEPFAAQRPRLIAVTVLTSMADHELAEIGVAGSSRDQVLRLAGLTRDAGLDGVVCSAREASLLKSELGKDFQLVTPGIRLPDSAGDDQRRVMIPEQALAQGSDYLVIGRPITQASDPRAALAQILERIGV